MIWKKWHLRYLNLQFCCIKNFLRIISLESVGNIFLKTTKKKGRQFSSLRVTALLTGLFLHLRCNFSPIVSIFNQAKLFKIFFSYAQLPDWIEKDYKKILYEAAWFFSWPFFILKKTIFWIVTIWFEIKTIWISRILQD